MIFGITKRAFGLVVIFTVVETAILVAWLLLAKPEPVVSVVVLFVGLLIEHTIATFAGTVAK